MVMIFQPKGAGTEHKEGTILVESPASLTGMAGISGNYVINTYVSNLPSTGQINANYEPTGAGATARFTGCAPCI